MPAGRICTLRWTTDTRTQVLLQKNAKVYIATRNKAKSEAAIAELKTATGKEAFFLELDLASLASVRKAAADFLAKEPELHYLFNNACVSATSP